MIVGQKPARFFVNRNVEPPKMDLLPIMLNEKLSKVGSNSPPNFS